MAGTGATSATFSRRRMLSVWLLPLAAFSAASICALRSSLNGRPVCSSYSRAITFTLVTNVLCVE
jgi:hypothetical protein